MNTTRAARFSVNVRPAGEGTFETVRGVLEDLGATFERGFGNLHHAQMMMTNSSGLDLKAVRAAVEAVAPEGAAVKIARLK